MLFHRSFRVERFSHRASGHTAESSTAAARSAPIFAAVLFLSLVVHSRAQSTNAVTTNRAPTRVVVVRPVSTIEDFRELLAMGPIERERVLSLKPADKRQKLVAKIAEYEAMSPAERELRLRMTQLRLYLVPMMKMSPAEREKQLARFSPEDRALFERRLKIWDEIPVQLQREFLENEGNLGFFIKWTDTSPEQRAQLLETFPPERRAQLEKEFARWSALPSRQRQQLYDRFNEFFELNEREKEKTLAALPKPERLQMEKKLSALESLSPEERKKSIEGVRQFVRMNADERRQFLKNAERWQSLSETERQAWRELMQRTPPLPPGIVPVPPLPHAVNVVSTNGLK